MHHMHIDRFAGMSSIIHALDPRVKLLTTLSFILLVVATPDRFFSSYLLYGLAILTVIYLSHIPLSYILKRSLAILPFILVVSIFVPFITPGPVLREFSIGQISVTVTTSGVVRFASIGMKAFISFLATITLVSSTRFGDLMRAAGAFRVPAQMVVVLSFMYRYLFILIDDVSHMLLARDLRGSRKGSSSILTASGGIIGALLVRSFEHADKLYYAMLLRGYSGRPVTLTLMKLKAADIVFSAMFIGVSVSGLIMGSMLHG